MVDTRNNLVDIHRFYINIYICVYLNVKNYGRRDDDFFRFDETPLEKDSLSTNYNYY